MHFLWIVSVFLHILASAFWIGGMLFLVIVLLPALRNHPDKAKLIQEAGLKFRTAGWIVLILLLLTGSFNLYFRGASLSLGYFTETSSGRLAGIKIILFSCILGLSAWHDFRTGVRTTKAWIETPNHPSVDRLRKISRTVGRLNLFLALVAAAIGVMLVRGIPW